MASKKRHEMSKEELLKNEKMLKVAFYALGIGNLILLALGLLLMTQKGNKFVALVFIPGAMTPILLGLINSLKAVKKEKVVRGLNN
ncbi:hypothetical protein [Paraflavitalea pollutisoli]|uniref:hypothetical protein n=1 Tax=Paraflavitalea pollutisoli TaxID=3034143 RepID=UPI0023EB2F14|nr:hypothetical protein [Paraflavitalea sp. H1-2-19X]